MSAEARELEETLARIKLKQAKLFEERLDRYLLIESQELSPERKKEVFESLLEAEDRNVSLESLNSDQKEGETEQ